MSAEYTELEKQRMKEKFMAMPPEQRAKVMEAFNASIPQEKPKIPVVTYKQLVQNWKDDPNVAKRIRNLQKNMNREKAQLRIVNKPGSILTDENGNKFMITKKGKSYGL